MTCVTTYLGYGCTTATLTTWEYTDNVVNDTRPVSLDQAGRTVTPNYTLELYVSVGRESAADISYYFIDGVFLISLPFYLCSFLVGEINNCV